MWSYIKNVISHNRITVFLMTCMAVGLAFMRLAINGELAERLVAVNAWVDFAASMFFFFIILLLHRLVHRSLNRIYPFERNFLIRLIIQVSTSFVIVFGIRALVIYLAQTGLDYRMPEEYRAFAYIIDVLFLALLNAVFIGDYFVEQWKKSALEREQLQKANMHSQFEALKNQVNPHFLFNSFTTLSELIYEDKEKASRYVDQLSVVYRYILKNNNVDAVTLRAELEFLNAYLYLLEIRYPSQLTVNIVVAPKDLEKRIPPITLQILLENAIKHNVISAESPLSVSITGDDGWLTIDNNIQLKSNRQVGSRLGLKNIQRRYQLLDNKKVSVQDQRGHFTVKLPLL